MLHDGAGRKFQQYPDPGPGHEDAYGRSLFHQQHRHVQYPGPGHEDADSRGLFHQQHPATPPPRFGSPSRPRQNAPDDANNITTLGIIAAASAMAQSVVWMALSLAASLAYRGVIRSPEPPSRTERWDDYATVLCNLYFKEHDTFPELPKEGLVTPRLMYRLAAATLVANAIWFITASVMLRQVRLGGTRSASVSVMVWAASTVIVTVVDVVLGAAMARDLVVLHAWPEAQDFPGDTITLVLCPVLVMVLALRGGVLLLANVGCMVVLLHRLSQLRKDYKSGPSSASASPSATKREGPIDAYLYRNDDRDSLGVQNPVFVPDEAATEQEPVQQSWASFKQDDGGPGPRSGSGSGYHQGPHPHTDRHANGANKHHAIGFRRALKDEMDDVSHLSWMEEVDKHVDARVRSVARPSAPPHRRFDGRGPDLGYPHGPGHRAGYPDPRHGHSLDQVHDSRLPRVRVNPDAPQFPFIPPPDYSPPTRRAIGLATGRPRGIVGPRSVRQNRY